MPNFDDFDLDLRGKDVTVNENDISDTDVITSLVSCNRNTKAATCFCSTCCTGMTVPSGCGC